MATFIGFEYVSPPELEGALSPLRESIEDSAKSIHTHSRHLSGIDSQIGSIEQRLADIEDALAMTRPPEDGPEPGEIAIGSPTELAKHARSWESGGKYVFTNSMTASIPLTDLPAGLQIRSLAGAEVKISAFVPLKSDFEFMDGLWRAPYSHYLPKHPATREGPWDGHRDRMAAHQFVVAGKLLKPVYKKADLAPGTFWIEGDPQAPEFVWIAAGAGTPPSDVYYAHHATLLSGAPGVSVEGITFEGGASTGKRGALKTNDGWHLRRCRCQLSAGPGYELTGKNVTVEECEGIANGQINFLIHRYENLKFIRCVSRTGNRKGFNASWKPAAQRS